MSSFSGLYVGASGLNVSQSALNVTAHNLANVDTKGFVRQQVVQSDFKYIKMGESYISSFQRGLGANIDAVRQVRDIFLDQAYRQEIGRQAFYESQYETISEIEGLFGELEGEPFQTTLNNFWISLQELAKEPDSIVARSSFVETAVNFLDRAEKISTQLRDYQINLNTKIQDQVNRINEIGDEIRQLNNKIRQYESTGVENANDLRDQRNNLLDELSKMVSISYSEDSSSIVYVNIEGVPFVSDNKVYHMGTVKVSDGTDMLKPIWLDHGMADVFNLDKVLTSENNTDIGSLKGLLAARGYKQANYTDIPVRENYETDGLYEKAVAEYNNTIGASVVMTVQAQFDQLIHGITTTINDVLAPNKEVTLYDGTVVRILDEDNAPVGDDTDSTMGEAIFIRKSTPRYEEREITVKNEDGSTDTFTAKVYIEEDPSDNDTLFTLGEIAINPKILHNYALIPLSSNKGTGDFEIDTVQKLLSVWQESFATLSPDSLTKCNFSDYYNAFISEIANIGEQYNKISTDQASMAESIDNKRMEIAGVSSDEELTNLIRFQHAYNASARYINAVNEMLENILEKLY